MTDPIPHQLNPQLLENLNDSPAKFFQSIMSQEQVELIIRGLKLLKEHEKDQLLASPTSDPFADETDTLMNSVAVLQDMWDDILHDDKHTNDTLYGLVL